MTCTVKRKRKMKKKNFYVANPSALHQHITNPPSHSISCRYFKCVYWAMLRLRYAAAATISIIVGGGAPHHCPHPAAPPSTSVAIFVTLRFSNLVPYVAILKTFHVKTLTSGLDVQTDYVDTRK